jgi:lipopolysaccharide biosynthesis glycosyltransferase
MKWYFSLNQKGIARYGQMVLVAVASCLKNTNLQPHFLFDGSKNPFTNYLTDQGVDITFQSVSFLNELLNAPTESGYNPEIARGAYLRTELSQIEHTDDFVLYTDVDVLFFDHPTLEQIVPDFFAAAPEADTGREIISFSNSVFNSGVMLLNLPKMRETYVEFVEFVKRNNFYFHGNGGYYDQGALNHFYKGMWSKLPEEMNWRPFAGYKSNISILHFHGSKPHDIQAVLNNSDDQVYPIIRKLISWQPEYYRECLDEFRSFVTPEMEKVLSETVTEWIGVKSI